MGEFRTGISFEDKLCLEGIISDWQEQKNHSAEAQHAWDNQFGLVPYQTPEEVLGIPKLRK